MNQLELDLIQLLKMVSLPVESRRDYKDYKYFMHFSNDDTSVYRKGRIWFYVIKGTTTIREYMEDFLIATDNKLIRHFDKTDRHFSSVRKNMKGRVFVVGHSLGGTKAMYLSKKYHLKGIAFVPFIPVLTAFTQDLLDSNRILKIIVDKDIFSNLALSSKARTRNFKVLKLKKGVLPTIMNSHWLTGLEKTENFEI